MRNIFVFFCLIYSTFAFNSLITIQNKILKKDKINISRKSTLILLPLLFSKKVFAENNKSDKYIEELRLEANRIIEIIEAQKSSINLSKLTNKTNKNNENNENNENLEIKNNLNKIFNSFKNDNDIKALKNIKKYCSDSNYIKLTSIDKLKSSFYDSKYAILLGKFTKYKITDYRYYIDKYDIEGYEVDIKVYADYKTMIYNSIQFGDMHYSKEDDNSKLHYVVYRWNFIKQKNNNYKLESCYLVANNE